MCMHYIQVASIPAWSQFQKHLCKINLKITKNDFLFQGRTSCRGHRFRQALWLVELRLGWALSFLWLAQTICVLYTKSMPIYLPQMCSSYSEASISISKKNWEHTIGCQISDFTGKPSRFTRGKISFHWDT